MRIVFMMILITIVCLVNYGQTNDQTSKPDGKLLEEARNFEKNLIEALRKSDRTALERMLADGFTFIHSTGYMETREEYLKNAGAGNLQLQRTELETLDETWRIFEGTTVIRYARSVMRNKAANTENRMRNIAVYVKTAKGWQWVSGQSTKLPVRPKAATIDARVMEDYAGTYEIGGGRFFTVTRENGVLFGLTTGRLKTELIPASDTTFVLFNEENDPGYMVITFVRDSGGKVSEAVLHLNGQEVWRAKRKS